MIPKIIHYCWFGRNPLPDLAVKCINSWKKFCPDYDIKEWNEENFDVHCCSYVYEAYSQRKWAFVSDYARFWILYNYGGLYFDTDVELIKSIDDIVSRGAFMGVEKWFASKEFSSVEDMQYDVQDENDAVHKTTHNNIDNNANNECKDVLVSKRLSANPGLGLAAAPGLGLYKEILDHYQNEHFINKNGNLNLTTVVKRVSSILLKHRITVVNDDMLSVCSSTIESEQCEVYIYQKDFFCPFNYETYDPSRPYDISNGNQNDDHRNNDNNIADTNNDADRDHSLGITHNTRSIHHFAASWHTGSMKAGRIINRFFAKRGMSHSVANKLIAAPFRLISKWRELGSIGTLRFVVNKLTNTPPPE